MDIITNYKDFEQDILTCFSQLIVEFDFKLIQVREGCNYLVGKNCSLKMTYDRGYINIDFKKPEDYQDAPGYNVWQVFEFLHPSTTAVKMDEIIDAKLQIENIADIIEKSLKNILEGDFSWTKNFIEEREKNNKMLNFAMHLPYEHPIKLKFWKNDMSWKDDVEHYLINNSIKL